MPSSHSLHIEIKGKNAMATDPKKLSREEMYDLTFGQALELLKKGYRLCRVGWNGRGMHIALTSPSDPNGMAGGMSRDFIYLQTVNREFVPWVASQSDILAEDWELAGMRL